MSENDYQNANHNDTQPSVDWSEEVARTNFKLYKENYSAGAQWRRDAKIYQNFRYGQHFSRAEEAEILKFRQAPLAISAVTAICDTAEALMTSAKPTIKVAPIGNPYQSDEENEPYRRVAGIYNYLLQKSWYDSLGGLQYDRVVTDSSNVGHGLFYIVPRNEYGEFTVDIKHLSWEYYFPHCQTKDPFYRDADNNIIAMNISYKSAYRLAKTIDDTLDYDRFEKEFLKGSFGTAIIQATNSTRLRETTLFTQRFVLEEKTAYIVTFKGSPSFKVYSELSPEIQSYIKSDDATYRTSSRFYLHEYTAIGNYGFKKVHEITQHNIIPVVYDHRNNPYPSGRVSYLYPLQRAFNKMIMVAILNGSLMNSIRVLAEENSIINQDEWNRNFAIPGATLRYKLPIPGISTPPIVIKAEPLSQAWLVFPQFLIQQMEYISGIFGIMMGNSEGAPNVFSTVASLQSAGGQKIKRRMAQVDASLSVVGEVAAEYYKNYSPLNGFSTSINEIGEMQAPMMYNKIKRVKGSEVAIELDPLTDLSLGFKQVRFTSATSNGYESGTEAALLTTLATQLSVPQLVPLILKRLNMPDVDKVMKSMDTAQQQAGQIEQMQKMLKEYEQKTNVMAGQIDQKGYELSKAQFDSKFTKVVEKAKNDPNFLNQIVSQIEEGNNGNGKQG
ncbi:MAG: hypothetical protein WC974_08945 [Thermoplasmata archaeon]